MLLVEKFTNKLDVRSIMQALVCSETNINKLIPLSLLILLVKTTSYQHIQPRVSMAAEGGQLLTVGLSSKQMK
jgi:hypothetical protein